MRLSRASRRHLCIGVLLFLCLLSWMFLCFLSYLVYYNLDVNQTSFSILKKASRPGEGKGSSHQTSGTQLSPASTVRTEDDVLLILMWFPPFGREASVWCCEPDMEGCQLTHDRSVFYKAHAVMFHHYDIGGVDNMPREPRPWFQKWIWFTWESPVHITNIPGLSDLFNLTSCYRQDSHIPVPYGYLTPLTHEDERFKLPEKDKLVCWVVSNWNPQLKRIQVYEELKNHIKVELYGRAHNRGLAQEEYDKLIPSCKFYLSWENSVDRDYMTEKLYNAMRMGAVPVVLGTSRANYEEHIPADSFIHVDDFASPKELAERLIYLDQNHTEYMKYLAWKQRYKVHTCVNNVCEACLYLKKHKEYQYFHDLSKWFWG